VAREDEGTKCTNVKEGGGREKSHGQQWREAKNTKSGRVLLCSTHISVVVTKPRAREPFYFLVDVLTSNRLPNGLAGAKKQSRKQCVCRQARKN